MTTECRSCGERISFAKAANGRWRPTAASYTALEPDADEVVLLLVNGEWTITNQTAVRVVKLHSCGEKLLGRPRTRVVDEDVVEADPVTGEVPEDDDDFDDEEDRQALLQQPWKQRERDRSLARHRPWDLAVDCPECLAPLGEPCVMGRGSTTYAYGPHQIRSHVTAFDEAWDQAWPPRHNQRGTQRLVRWLAEHHDVLTSPPLTKETPDGPAHQPADAE